MQARTPRTYITLTPESRAVFVRLAAAQRRPVATLIAELLHEMAPVWANVVPVVERAVEVIKRTGQRERDMYAKAEADLLQHMNAALGVLSSTEQTISQLDLDLAGASHSRKSALASSMPSLSAMPTDPPDTNRGVNIPVASKKRHQTFRINANPHVSLQNSSKRRAARKTP